MATSNISKKEILDSEAVSGSEIRTGVFDLIRKDYPDFSGESVISIDELNKYRRLYLTQLVQQERGELAQIDLDVMKAIQSNSILSENITVRKKDPPDPRTKAGRQNSGLRRQLDIHHCFFLLSDALDVHELLVIGQIHL